MPKLIVLESLYSMEGLRSPLKQIVSLAKEFNALTYLDEVHSVGLYGSEGRGIAEEQNVSDEIDIINGTLSKAFGQMGGYVAASSDIIDFIRSFAPGFIFTSSANPSIAAASIKAIEVAKKSENLREDIRQNSDLIRAGLKIWKFLISTMIVISFPFTLKIRDCVKMLLIFSSKITEFTFNLFSTRLFQKAMKDLELPLRQSIKPKTSLDFFLL